MIRRPLLWAIGAAVLYGCVMEQSTNSATGLLAGARKAGPAGSGFTEIPAASTVGGATPPGSDLAQPTGASPAAPGSLAVYPAAGGPLVADSAGLFRFDASGSFTQLGRAFTEDVPPAAIAESASGSVFAAGKSGIYALSGSSWIRVAEGNDVTDLALSPAGSFGLAVQDDGGVWRFDGQTWKLLAAPLSAPLGGVAVVSSTESYVVGQGLLDEWNGSNFIAISPPDPTNPVAGLAVAPLASGSVLLATTRAALWQRTGSSWTAVPGPASSAFALGIPSFAAGAGIVTEVGNASPSVFLFDGSAWAPGPSLARPLDGVGAIALGSALAMTADGSGLWHLASGTWSALTPP